MVGRYLIDKQGNLAEPHGWVENNIIHDGHLIVPKGSERYNQILRFLLQLPAERLKEAVVLVDDVSKYAKSSGK